MEEGDEDPAPTTRVGPGVIGVHPAPRPTGPSIPLELVLPDLSPPITSAYSASDLTSPAGDSHNWPLAPIPALGIP